MRNRRSLVKSLWLVQVECDLTGISIFVIYECLAMQSPNNSTRINGIHFNFWGKQMRCVHMNNYATNVRAFKHILSIFFYSMNVDDQHIEMNKFKRFATESCISWRNAEILAVFLFRYDFVSTLTDKRMFVCCCCFLFAFNEENAMCAPSFAVHVLTAHIFMY